MPARIKKEFEAKKIEFLKRNIVLVREAWDKYDASVFTPMAHTLIAIARREKLYSPKTVNIDIARGLKHTYERNFK